MTIVKANNILINLDKCQGVQLDENIIVFHLPEDQAFNMEYSTSKEASDAFDKLFVDLAETPGIDGAVLTGNFV